MLNMFRVWMASVWQLNIDVWQCVIWTKFSTRQQDRLLIKVTCPMLLWQQTLPCMEAYNNSHYFNLSTGQVTKNVASPVQVIELGDRLLLTRWCMAIWHAGLAFKHPYKVKAERCSIAKDTFYNDPHLTCSFFKSHPGNLKGEIGSLFNLCVIAMGRQPYWPSCMEVSCCIFGFGAIIRRDLRPLSFPCDSLRNNLYPYVI